MKFVAVYVVGKHTFMIYQDADSKSPGGNLMRVRFPPPAPFDINGLGVTLDPFYYVLGESIVPGFVPIKTYLFQSDLYQQFIKPWI